MVLAVGGLATFGVGIALFDVRVALVVVGGIAVYLGLFFLDDGSA